MKSNLIAIAACCGLLAPLAAQDPAGKDPGVALKIDIVAMGRDIPGLSLGNGAGNGSVTALAFRYATPVRYAGSRILGIFQDPAAVLKHEEELHKLAAGIDNQGMPPAGVATPARARASAGDADPAAGVGRRLIARATLPVGSSRATILLAPGKNGLYQAHVIDDDPSGLPYGHLRVHNHSPFPIALRANGGEAREIQPRKSFLFSTRDDTIIYELSYQTNNKWQMQENNMVRVKPSEQARMIILKSADGFFANSDGSRGGFLQVVTLRRAKDDSPLP